MKAVVFVVVSLLFIVPADSDGQGLDQFGNLETSAAPGHPPAPTDRPTALGDVLGSFAEPVTLFDLTFYDGNLWGANVGSGIVEMNPDSGALLSTLTIVPATSGSAGLGYDTLRGLFVVTDAIADTVVTVNPASGAVQSTFSSPGSGPVGATYDTLRDGYWISDFSTNNLDLIDPATGATHNTCSTSLHGASRIAGVSYAPLRDRLVFNSRDDAVTYIINAGDCSLAASFATPPAAVQNNGAGVTIRPTDQTIYLRNSDDSYIYIVDSAGEVPVSLQSFSAE